MADPRDPAIGDRELAKLLKLAALIWNAHVLRAHGRGDGGLAELLAELDRAGEPVRTITRAMIEALIERKRRQFAHDERIIGEITVWTVAGTGEVRVRAEAFAFGESPPARARPHQPKQFVVDLRHYATESGLWSEAPRPARALANYFGKIAAVASLAKAGQFVSSSVDCRRRGCHGRVLLRRLAKHGEIIDWSCSDCLERGEIHGWRGTAWDLSQRERGLRALGKCERLALELAAGEKRALEDSIGLQQRVLQALVAAERRGKRWVIDAAREELEDLLVAVEAELHDGAPRNRRGLFDRIETRLLGVLGVPTAQRDAAITACVLSYRALAERAQIRGVPRAGPRGIHRLSVVLEEVEPRVQRELDVSSDTTLEELHAILQVAFGWSESHLHIFEANGRRFTRADHELESKNSPSHLATLADIAPRAGDRFLYEYDFGDSWRHAIEVAAILPPERGELAPRCHWGEGASPPEDCGGPGGYAEFLQAVDDPTHPAHEQYADWLGQPFDPHAFDLDHTNRMLRQLARWMS